MAIQDEELVGRIRSALLRDQRVSSQPIEVSATNGVVTLAGQVQSYRRRLAAIEIAASFHGCRRVIDELAVEPSTKLSDEAVANNVRVAIEAHEDVSKEAIAVAVSQGAVTLSGSAGCRWERLLAEDITMSCRGVRSVRNELLVDFVQQREDESLARDIQEALGYADALQGFDLRVAVSGHCAVLSGEVNGLSQKRAAESVVERFGLHAVRNDITVATP